VARSAENAVVQIKETKTTHHRGDVVMDESTTSTSPTATASATAATLHVLPAAASPTKDASAGEDDDSKVLRIPQGKRATVQITANKPMTHESALGHLAQLASTTPDKARDAIRADLITFHREDGSSSPTISIATEPASALSVCFADLIEQFGTSEGGVDGLHVKFKIAEITKEMYEANEERRTAKTGTRKNVAHAGAT